MTEQSATGVQVWETYWGALLRDDSSKSNTILYGLKMTRPLTSITNKPQLPTRARVSASLPVAECFCKTGASIGAWKQGNGSVCPTVYCST